MYGRNQLHRRGDDRDVPIKRGSTKVGLQSSLPHASKFLDLNSTPVIINRTAACCIRASRGSSPSITKKRSWTSRCPSRSCTVFSERARVSSGRAGTRATYWTMARKLAIYNYFHMQIIFLSRVLDAAENPDIRILVASSTNTAGTLHTLVCHCMTFSTMRIHQWTECWRDCWIWTSRISCASAVFARSPSE